MSTGTPKVQIVEPPGGDVYEGWFHLPKGISGRSRQHGIDLRVKAWLQYREKRGYELNSPVGIGGPYEPLDPEHVLVDDLYVVKARFRSTQRRFASLDEVLAWKDKHAEWGLEEPAALKTETDPNLPPRSEAERVAINEGLHLDDPSTSQDTP